MGAGKRCLPGFVGFGPLRLEQAKLVYGKITLCSKARSAHYISYASSNELVSLCWSIYSKISLFYNPPPLSIVVKSCPSVPRWRKNPMEEKEGASVKDEHLSLLFRVSGKAQVRGPTILPASFCDEGQLRTNLRPEANANLYFFYYPHHKLCLLRL